MYHKIAENVHPFPVKRFLSIFQENSRFTLIIIDFLNKMIKCIHSIDSFRTCNDIFLPSGSTGPREKQYSLFKGKGREKE